MPKFDYIIVGAGPAGCVLAQRLSADPVVHVLLIEAGGRDVNPLIAMPGGFGQLLGDPGTAWHYPVRPFGPAQQTEHWVRGKTLGGSSAINGMVYSRGSRADWDTLESLGNPGWGWSDILPVFRTIEDHSLGGSAERGNGGPLQVSTVERADPLLEDVLTAGTRLGWRRTADLNQIDEERIGHATATVRDGHRVSAAHAFLHPVTHRPNLTVAVDTVIDQVIIENGRAAGVRGRSNEDAVEAHAAREVILSAGAIATPKILQLSGIGPAETLRSAGVDVVVESPNVGARLREHRVLTLQTRLTTDLGYNTQLSTAAGQARAAQEYVDTRGGPLAAPPCDLIGFAKTDPRLDRPDVQIQVSPFSIQPLRPGEPIQIEPEPGMMTIGYCLRPDSEGRLGITSAQPDAPLEIDPNYLATEHDRNVSIGALHIMRRLIATAPLAGHIDHETLPGSSVQTDDDIIDAALTTGGCGYHTIGTCAMGPDQTDVVDPTLRVRGVRDLRVIDASVFPVMISGNLNGPVTALAWRAADLIMGAA
jgi:choline dehydrogenase